MTVSTSTNANERASQNGRQRSSHNEGRGVLLLNLGTPDAPEPRAVRTYLTEFLSDPEVIRLPRRWRWANYPLGAMIARFRAKHSASLYRNIWTDRGSPLKVITEDQTSALETALPKGWRAFYAMRYGNPTVDSVLAQIVEAGVTDLVVIPMYPQYSGPTTKTALSDLYRALRELGRHLHVSVRSAWFDDASYIEAQAKLVRDHAVEHGLNASNSFLLFSTHSMPESYIKEGDPYQEQVLRTVELVLDRLGWPADRSSVAYQSKLGPVPWLSPSTESALEQLAKDKEQNVLVCPVSFTADCLETLEEIGIGYRAEFERSGGKLHLCPSLNTHEAFISTLSTLALRGPKPAGLNGASKPPLMRNEAPGDDVVHDVDSLVMIGASVAPRIASDDHLNLEHVTSEELRCVKRPQNEVASLLRSLVDAGDFAECFIWNTCSRFELYGFHSCGDEAGAMERITAHARTLIMGDADSEIALNVLRGEEARYHLMRTAVGLNSGLPGDAEVPQQLEAAHRIAHHCETGGPSVQRLLEGLENVQASLEERTTWNRFRFQYCPVALRRVARSMSIDWREAKIAVLGGSLTASSVIRTLRDLFDVPPTHVTAIHRTQSRGEQLKRLKAALGEGVRLRVDAYSDTRVLDALVEADLVVFAADSRTPIFDADQLVSARVGSDRHLTIVDFNSFGSIAGMEHRDGVTVFDADRLEREIALFSDGLCECPAFNAAREQAETWITDANGQPADTSRRDAGDHSAAGENGVNGSNGATAGASDQECSCIHRGDANVCPRSLLEEKVQR